VALLVLGDLRVRIVRSDIDDDGHLAQARELGSTKPLRTESNPIAAFGPESVDHDGLKNTVQRDVGRQLPQFVGRKLGARVARIFVDELDRCDQRLAR
jgi:hypothetical protein